MLILAVSTNTIEVIEMHNIEQEIRDVVVSHPMGWAAIIGRNKEYVEYLNDRYPQLNDRFYRLSTKIYWLMNGLNDFPLCPICGKSDNYKTKNVDSGGYPAHCCCRCTQLDKDVRRKNAETNMRLYNVTNGGASKQA